MVTKPGYESVDKTGNGADDEDYEMMSNYYHDKNQGATEATQEQRDKLNAELTSLRREKTNFDREVLKWDERSNEIVVLAKQMCVIMMDMIKYTRGFGPLKNAMDIIAAAKQITEIGVRLEKLCRKLADECPESQTKKELLEYLNALPLFCNQLAICTKVQENIIDPIVQWKMKPPELKPLVAKPKPNERPGLIRKASNKAKFSPIRALAEFQI